MPVKPKLEFAFLIVAVGVIEWLPETEVPHHDRAAAILAFGNHAFKLEIFEWMVFDVDGKSLLGWVEAGSLGDGPTLEHAVQLQTEIVVQSPGLMLLHDESPLRLVGVWRIGGGLRCAREAAFTAIVVQSHSKGNQHGPSPNLVGILTASDEKARWWIGPKFAFALLRVGTP